MNKSNIASSELSNLCIDKELAKSSLKVTVCSRNLFNASFILTPNEYTLLNFLVFMAEKNVITYSIKLLKQYDKATSRMIEIYGSDKVMYSTSRDVARNSFIKLIESGYLIRLSGKNKFMINPMVVIPNGLDPRNVQEMYLEALSSADVSIELTKLYNNISK